MISASPLRIVIADGTESAAFTLPKAVSYAKISTTGTTGRTLTLQDVDTDGSGFTDTTLTATTSDTTETRWTAEDLAPYSALASVKGGLRLSLSASDSVTVVFYSRD